MPTVEADNGEPLPAKQVKELQKRMAQIEKENLILKRRFPSELVQFFHATLRKRLDTVHNLHFQHDIKLLCKVLGINRSTYYKHWSCTDEPHQGKSSDCKGYFINLCRL